MHFLQSKYWREIKEKLGNKTFDAGNIWFQTTKVPFLNKYIGYVPRPTLEDIDWDLLYSKAKEAGCIYVSIDPVNTKAEQSLFYGRKYTIKKGTPTHLQENVVIDFSKSEEELLANMKQKHRYNLKLAQKKGVEVKIGESDEMFDEFINLYKKTVLRQKYFGRSEEYIRTVWSHLKDQKSEKPLTLIATAYFEGTPLSSWMLFLFEDTIYYPYGGSSDEHRNVMATYLLVWEIIKYGKNNGYRYLDLWGIEQKKGKQNEAEYDSFSRFKLGFGGQHIVYEDTVDLVIENKLYPLVNLAQNLRESSRFIKRLIS